MDGRTIALVIQLEPLNSQSRLELDKLKNKISVFDEPKRELEESGKKLPMGLLKPIFKDPETRSKKPLRRLEIEEVGVEKPAQIHRSLPFDHKFNSLSKDLNVFNKHNLTSIDEKGCEGNDVWYINESKNASKNNSKGCKNHGRKDNGTELNIDNRLDIVRDSDSVDNNKDIEKHDLSIGGLITTNENRMIVELEGNRRENTVDFEARSDCQDDREGEVCKLDEKIEKSFEKNFKNENQSNSNDGGIDDEDDDLISNDNNSNNKNVGEGKVEKKDKRKMQQILPMKNYSQESSGVKFSQIKAPLWKKIPTCQNISNFSFQVDWKKLRNDDETFYHYLKSIEPSQYRALFGEFLDQEILSKIIKILNVYYQRDNLDPFKVLFYLTQVKRFTMITMFLDEADRKTLKNVFSTLEASKRHPNSEVNELYKMYA